MTRSTGLTSRYHFCDRSALLTFQDSVAWDVVYLTSHDICLFLADWDPMELIMVPVG